MPEADELKTGFVSAPDGTGVEEEAGAIAIMFTLLPRHVQEQLYNHVRNLAMEHLGFVLGTATEQGIRLEP